MKQLKKGLIFFSIIFCFLVVVASKQQGLAVSIQQTSANPIPVEHSPVWNEGSGQRILTIFTDLRCSHCLEAHKSIQYLKKQYQNKIRIMVKHFPLERRKESLLAALATFCSEEQSEDKYWQMIDLIYEEKNQLTIKKLERLANSLALDSKKFLECIRQEKYYAKVRKDQDVARALGVNAVPTFYLDQERFIGASAISTIQMLLQ